VVRTHHHEILRCVEARRAEDAARHTQSHVRFLRDALVGARRSTVPGRMRLLT
jgi:hypothetical protein